MNSETIEKIVFECGLQTPAVIIPSIALLLLCAWMLFRERHNLGTFWVATFWCLRAVAAAVLVWMFLQPARVTETKSTLSQSVAVVVDNSDSMQVIDPQGEGQEVLWGLINSKSDDATLRDTQVALDSAIMALNVAESRWNVAQNQLQVGFDSSGIKERFEEIAFALQRVSTQLDEKFCEHWKDSSDQEQAREFASQCSELAEFATEFEIDHSDTDTGKRIRRSQESLDALVDLNRLAQTWSRTVANTISQSLTETMVQDAGDRQSHVMQLVKETDEHHATNALETGLSVKRFMFGDQLTPVLDPNGWPKLTKQSEAEVEEETLDVDQSDETDNPQTQSTSATNLTAAIEQIMQLAPSQSIRSVLFLTDGAHNAVGGPTPAEIVAKLNNLAINFLPIGSLNRPRDIQLAHVGHPRSVIRGDKILIDALISSAGFEGQKINLELRADGELIDQQALLIDADQLDIRHSFDVQTKQRLQESIEFELSIKPLKEETSKNNNKAIFRVAVVRDKIRVMLADHNRSWEYGYLEQLFFRDEHLEHETILFAPRLRATGNLKADAALPVTVEGWSQYDVAIISDLTPDEFPIPSQESLVEFVKEKGGIAILIAGHRGMPHKFEDQPLASLLPVEKSEGEQAGGGYHVSVNPAAANLEAIRLDNSQVRSTQLWKQIYEVQPIMWISEYATPRPSARRLLDAVPFNVEGEEPAPNDRPSWVCWQQLGSGRVVYLSAPDTFRMRYRRGDRLHHLFWAQLMRWIISNEPSSSSNGLVRLVTDKVRYTQQEPIEVSALLSEVSGDPSAGADVQATFVGADEEKHVFNLLADETQPGRYVAKVEDLQPGAYRVSLQGDVDDLMDEGESVETFVNVITSLNIEQVNTTCNRPLMKQIAQASGGYVIPPTALAEWLTLQTGMPETISQIERVPLWNRWSCLWVAFGCLATEWFVRRLKGLT